MDTCDTMPQELPQDVGGGSPSSGVSGSNPIEEPKHVESEGKDEGIIEVGVEVSEGKVTFTAAALSDETEVQQQQANIDKTTQPASSGIQTALDPTKQEHAHAPEPPNKVDEEVPPGWGGVKYISPAEQQKVRPKAKEKAKAKSRSSKPRATSKAKPKQAAKKRGRSRAESASAAKVSRKGSAGKGSKPKESKRKNKGNENPPEKSRKVDLNPKEALRSKKCCAYQKVLARLRKEGVAEDEAKKQAKLVARMQ